MEQQAQQVLHLRKRYPLWGKRKLWRVLVRERGWTLSESTVGRIVARLVRLGRVEPVSFYYGQVKPKRRRQFTHHAKRWRYGMKAKAPGELMQADHMSVSFTEGACVKEFKATCGQQMEPSGHQPQCQTVSGLPSGTGAVSHPLSPGGRRLGIPEFEQACQEAGIPLYVLPPKKPEYNGCVERANGTSRYEFYPFYEGPLTVAAINQGGISDPLQYLPSP